MPSFFLWGWGGEKGSCWATAGVSHESLHGNVGVEGRLWRSVTQAPDGLEGCSLGKQEALSEKGAGAGRSRLGRWNVGA